MSPFNEMSVLKPKCNQNKSALLFSSLPLKNRVGITTGDPEGIGQIVTQKALTRLGPKKHFQFVVWTSHTNPPLKLPKFKTKAFSNPQAALQTPFLENTLLEIKSQQTAGCWVEEAARLCLKKKLSSLTTGPLSKITLQKSHPKDMGHTGLLKRLSKTENVFMAFLGSHFHVILLTDHVPLKEIVLKKEKIETLFKQALLLRDFLKLKKPLGVLGLNPHAGEAGLLGKEEIKVLKPVMTKFPKKDIQGPLPPDAAFLKKNWKAYSFFIALYHDQGLIPFKMIHSHKGAAFSLGLPFIRTSVDHGTGIGLKPKDALPDSLILALRYNLRFVRRLRS